MLFGRSSRQAENESQEQKQEVYALHGMQDDGEPVTVEAFAGIATLKAKQGNLEEALELSLIILNHPTSLQETKNRADRLRAELESRLTSQQIEAVQARAQTKTFDAVVNEELKTTDAK